MTPEQITTITKHYAYTDDDKTTLATFMAEAYLHAKQQAYNRAHATAGQHVTFAQRQYGAEDMDKARAWAAPIAEGIAETYESLLRSQLEQMQESVQEGLWQGIKDVVQRVSDWFLDFMGWKPDQIADDTWSEGDNDGTEQFVEDVIDSGMDYSMLRVRVEPGESSSDYCKEYAGNDYAFDDVGSACPNFPTHSRCIHYLVVYVDDGSGG